MDGHWSCLLYVCEWTQRNTRTGTHIHLQVYIQNLRHKSAHIHKDLCWQIILSRPLWQFVLYSTRSETNLRRRCATFYGELDPFETNRAEIVEFTSTPQQTIGVYAQTDRQSKKRTAMYVDFQSPLASSFQRASGKSIGSPMVFGILCWANQSGVAADRTINQTCIVTYQSGWTITDAYCQRGSSQLRCLQQRVPMQLFLVLKSQVLWIRGSAPLMKRAHERKISDIKPGY